MLKRVLEIVSLVDLRRPPALAQQAPAPIKRTPLQKFDVSGTNYETVIGIAELAANVNVGRHTHPGPESGYVLEGDFTLLAGSAAIAASSPPIRSPHRRTVASQSRSRSAASS